jgi:hypothetical protein
MLAPAGGGGIEMNTHAGRKLSADGGADVVVAEPHRQSVSARTDSHDGPKAKELSRFAEGVLAQPKAKTLESRRRVAGQVNDKDVRKKIYDVLVPRYQSRVGGMHPHPPDRYAQWRQRRNGPDPWQ